MFLFVYAIVYAPVFSAGVRFLFGSIAFAQARRCAGFVYKSATVCSMVRIDFLRKAGYNNQKILAYSITIPFFAPNGAEDQI